MDNINCQICNSNDEYEISKKGRFGLKIRTVICKQCGLVFTNPRLSKYENEIFYKMFYKIFFRGEEVPSNRHINNQLRKASKIYTFIREHGYDIKKSAKILDIGSSSGAALLYFKNQGFNNVFGVEPSEKFADYSRDILNIKTFCGEFEKFKSSEKYDFVIMRDVIEHFLNPLEIIKKLMNNLHSKSFIYIETNNIHMPLDPTEKYEYQFHYAHPYIFSPVSLRNLMSAAGFDIKHIDADRYMQCIAVPSENHLNGYVSENYIDIVKSINRFDRKRIYYYTKSKIRKIFN